MKPGTKEALFKLALILSIALFAAGLYFNAKNVTDRAADRVKNEMETGETTGGGDMTNDDGGVYEFK